VYKINFGNWFRVQALFAAGYFAPALACSLSRRSERLFMVLLIILISLPTTWNFLKLRNDTQYTEITRDKLETVSFLKKETPGDSVFLEPPNFNGPSLSSHLAGRSSVLSHFRTFYLSKASPATIRGRMKDISAFFDRQYQGDRKTILKKYGVNYLLIPKLRQGFFDRFSWSSEVFSNKGFVVYKINL
ncbi:MAG: hypothetical protein SV775_02490, partial [Thermodesulfobacteriota bacterium]|nr:hypothetical protein [Thermodesulfobacteriota bacterium]